MRQIIYVTGNEMKLLSARLVLEPLGIDVVNKKIDCPEIQSNSIEEVACFSSKYASDYLKCDTLKNDSGLVIPALNGFPSAYTSYCEDTIGEDGILKLMEGIDDRYAYFLEAFAYTEYGKEPVVFVSKTEGIIAYEKSGEYGWSYDRIFIPKGKDKSLAHFPDEERARMWSSTALEELADYLKSK